jgi:hypothetical protein
MILVVNFEPQPIPSSLGLNPTFNRAMISDEKLSTGRADGRLYVGVIVAHSNRHFLIRVPPNKPKKISGGGSTRRG